MIDNTYHDSLILKRNTDSYGNPISINIVDIKPVMDNHSCVVLSQLPDENFGITIDGFTEVYGTDHIGALNFKVDYPNGVIYFNPLNIGKSITIDYKGIGCELIYCSRIASRLDAAGNVIETLEELIERGKNYLELIDSLGGAATVISRIEADIDEATTLYDLLHNDIVIAKPLQENLHNDIIEAGKFKDELAQDVREGKVLALDLERKITEGSALDVRLSDDIKIAADNIAIIEAAGNKSFIVEEGELTLEGEFYTKTINHNMNSENLQIAVLEDNNGVMSSSTAIYDSIDKDNIKIKVDSRKKVKVIIAASYYNGGVDIAEEVKEARGDKETLSKRLNEIDIMKDITIPAINESLETKASKRKIDIKDYGVIGNSNFFDNGKWYEDEQLTILANDDTDIIERVLNNNSDCEFIFPSGNYYISRRIDINSENIKICGFGKSTVFIKDKDIDLIFFAENKKYIHLESVSFKTSPDTEERLQKYSFCNFRFCDFLRVVNCNFNSYVNGDKLSMFGQLKTHNSNNILIAGNVFEGSAGQCLGSENDIGSSRDDVAVNNIIVNNILRDFQDTGIGLWTNVYNTIISNNVISGAVSQNYDMVGIDIAGATDCIISNNIIENSTFGIRCLRNLHYINKNIRISCNVIKNQHKTISAPQGIKVINSTHIFIENNSIIGNKIVGSDGVYIGNSYGNQLEQGYNLSENIVLKNNFIRSFENNIRFDVAGGKYVSGALECNILDDCTRAISYSDATDKRVKYIINNNKITNCATITSNASNNSVLQTENNGKLIDFTTETVEATNDIIQKVISFNSVGGFYKTNTTVAEDGAYDGEIVLCDSSNNVIFGKTFGNTSKRTETLDWGFLAEGSYYIGIRKTPGQTDYTGKVQCLVAKLLEF